MAEEIQEFAEQENIEVFGARVHNLKNINTSIPRNKLVVITGLSGSGKSSLAFDTIFAEGQRRYMESLSVYARQFLGNMERPDVDKITGLSPVISIEQKTTNRNPRSTVGTITEVYDFLRLLYARTGEAFSYVTGEKMIKYTDEQILNAIFEKFADKKILILAPLVKGRKGHYRELFEQIRKWGFLRVRVDGEVKEMTARFQLDRYKIHDIEVVIDRLEVNEENRKRIYESFQTAMKHGKGVIMVMEHEADHVVHFSRFLMCPTSGISYDEPAPNLFSFNSPYGACPQCNGLGSITEIDIKKVIPNKKLSINKGGITPLGEYRNVWIYRMLEAIGHRYDYTLSTPLEDIPENVLNIILYGTEEMFRVKDMDNSGTYNAAFEGVVGFIKRQYEESESKSIEKWVEAFMNEITCPSCKGARLKKEALHFKIDNRSIADLANSDITELGSWFSDLESRLSDKQNIIAKEILKEIRARIGFLLGVGLDYLTLNRPTKSLSGGEAQRIRLATQIGSKLVGVLYILDEPSIGLHQRDNHKLIQALKELRDSGNSVIVVEHDKDIMQASDYIIDIGPKAGIHGGRIVAEGTYSEFVKQNSLTAQYLNNKITIEVPKVRREGNGKHLTLFGASGHNLKNVDVTFPLGKMICVSGVSGSGKSSLINETLYPILLNHIYHRSTKKPLKYKKIEGIEHIDKIIEIDQSPIGRTPRSNPATYTDIFGPIRDLYASLPEAKIRGYKPGRFSFNVKGGRCETCQGAGLRTIEMNFLPDVYVQCESCNGKRYNRETLEIRFKGKSIADVLDMTVEDAVDFFDNIHFIRIKIKALNDVGLGYIKLGQQSTTLSGGEAQRVKLATELAKKDTGNTFYILDEPTTGLHFEDIRILLDVLNKLVNHGNTVLIIEHNMDFIKVADHVIDIGPEGGEKGGNVLFAGLPEDLAKHKTSYTAKFLKEELKTNFLV